MISPITAYSVGQSIFGAWYSTDSSIVQAGWRADKTEGQTEWHDVRKR